MASFIILVVLTLGQLYLTASQVEFNKAGSFTAVSGEKLVLNCTATSVYVIEVMEIGEVNTIEEKLQYSPPQLGDPSASYEPEECHHSDNEIPCSKIVHITVNSSIDGKSYQCRIFKREGSNNYYIYSQGGYLQVKNAVTPTTSVSRPPLTLQSSATVSCSPSPVTSQLPLVPQDTPSISSPVPDYSCECSAGSAFKAVKRSLLAWTVLLPLLVFLL